MNSKDLMGIESIPDYFSNDIDAVKIEGRMKSAFMLPTPANNIEQPLMPMLNHQMIFLKWFPS